MYMGCLLLVCKTEIPKELSSFKKILLCRIRKRCNYIDFDYGISVSHSKPKLIVFSTQINSRVTTYLPIDVIVFAILQENRSFT